MITELTGQPGLACSQVNLQPAEAQHVVGGRVRDRSTQQRLYPCQQLARLEGFGQIVISAQFEADDPVHRLAARREHQQREMAGAVFSAQLAAKIQAVAVGQHQVENQGVEGFRGQALAALRERPGRLDLEAGTAQVVAHHRGQARVVIDQQQSGEHGMQVITRVGSHGGTLQRHGRNGIGRREHSF